MVVPTSTARPYSPSTGSRSTHAPVPQWRQAYKEIYPIYADIYGRIKPLNDRIANLKIGD